MRIGDNSPAGQSEAAFKGTSNLKGIYLGFLVACTGLFLNWTPFGFDIEERYGLTWLFWARGPRTAPPEVLLVGLDRRSLKKSGWAEKPEQWPRDRHAQFIRRLSKACARAIVYDLFFKTPHSTREDKRLAQAIQDAGNVALVERIEIRFDDPIPNVPQENVQKLEMPIAVLADAAAGVGPLPLPNAPGGVTGYWAFKASVGDIPTLPTLAFQLFALDAYQDFLELMKKVDPVQAAALPADRRAIIASKDVTGLALRLRRIFLGDPQLADRMRMELDEPSGRRLAPATQRKIRTLLDLYAGPDWHYLNFYGATRRIKTISFPDAFQLAESEKACTAQNIFTGKVILVGMAETSPVEQKDRDIFDTVFTDARGVKLSGSEIGATAIANLIENRPVRRVSYPRSFAILIIWAFLISLSWRRCRSPVAASITLSAALGYGGFAFYAFNTSGIWYPVVIPLGQLLLGGTLAIARNHKDIEKRMAEMRLALIQWLPPDAVEQIVTSPNIVRKAEGLVYGTCLHTDIAGFTPISEAMDPLRLSVMMDEYFKTIGKPVTRNNGFVSDQTGDAMLAIWAAAKPDIDLQQQACAGALEICESLIFWQKAREYPVLNTRLGLHAGRIAVGGMRIGTTQHYRSFGAIVNAAQRIQSLNKTLRTRILASEEVVEGLSAFLLRPVGTFALVGLTVPLDIYEILGPRPDTQTPYQHGDSSWLCAAFTDALDAYRDGHWQTCIEQLLEILKIYPEDGPSHFYLKRCEFYRHHPPAGIWDPVIRQSVS